MKAVFNRMTWGEDHNRGETSDVVGLPDVAHTAGVVDYQDTEIRSKTAHVPVSSVVDRVEAGQGVGMKTEIVEVPRTEMRLETVHVPDVQMKTEIVEKPVTVVTQVPEIVKDVEMREEVVAREEVVLDKQTVQMPATELHEITVEKPVIRQQQMVVQRPEEILRDVSVVRPQDVVKKIKLQRPVQVVKKYRVQRPETVTRRVTVQRAVPLVQTVNITQPEITEKAVTIQVPHTEEEVVTYQKPVTMIRPADEELVHAHGTPHHNHHIEPIEEGHDREFISETVDSHSHTRDWSKIPVGLPFTELQARQKAFTVTKLHDEVAPIRQTWMNTHQFQKKDYKLEPVEVDVTETVMREQEVEVVETVLEDYEVDVEVSVMHEVMEKWPVTKGREEAVTTSMVTLEPTTAVMPELTMKAEVVEVPRIVEHAEVIQKPYTVEREVMVDKASTVMQPVEVQRPVIGTREVTVEKPHIVTDRIEVQVPETVTQDVHVQHVQDEMVVVREDEARHTVKQVAYQQAATVMKATGLGQDVVVDPATETVYVDEAARLRAIERTRDMTSNIVDGAHGIVPTTGHIAHGTHDTILHSGEKNVLMGNTKVHEVAPGADFVSTEGPGQAVPSPILPGAPGTTYPEGDVLRTHGTTGTTGSTTTSDYDEHSAGGKRKMGLMDKIKKGLHI